KEVNLIQYILNEFEMEYWGVLSDYHLRLDYNKSFERDKFYNLLEKLKRSLSEFLKIVEDYHSAAVQSYKSNLKSMMLKARHSLLVETGTFIDSVKVFLDILIKDNADGGNLILNPTDKLNFDKIMGKKKLEGMEVIDGLKFVNKFINEAIVILNIPDLKV
ncbi:MAG: hypothetical protein KAS39_08245, partial [Actinomycetia bacterium]|nr:hypothetical protein [Actinomycetes bacterium]